MRNFRYDLIGNHHVMTKERHVVDNTKDKKYKKYKKLLTDQTQKNNKINNSQPKKQTDLRLKDFFIKLKNSF